MTEFDLTDRRLLNALQGSLQIVERPFAMVADQLAADAGATRCIILPAIRLFKIAVEYDMIEKITDSKPAPAQRKAPRRELRPREKEIIRVCQEDLPIAARPFAEAAHALGVSQ